MFDPFEPGRIYTVQEYIRLEDLSDIKREFHYGHVFPVGSPPPPAAIPNPAAVFSQLSKHVLALLNQPNVTARNLAEPDEKGATICAKRTTVEDAPTSTGGFSKPSAIILLTSHASFVGTRGEVFDVYRQKESVMEFVWIFADHPRAEIYRRGSDGTWRIEFFNSLAGEFHLQSLGVRFEFADVYAIPGYSFVEDPIYSPATNR